MEVWCHAEGMSTIRHVLPAATLSRSGFSRQNQVMRRADLIDRAAPAFEVAGRGVIVKLMEDVEPRNAPREEMKARLVEEKADPGLLVAVLIAVDKYEPRWQAVYLLEQEECCTVTLVSHNRSEVVGSVSWTPVH